MADPFEALGSISGASPLSGAPPPPQQQQRAPQPGWPGINNASAVTASFSQQQYSPSTGHSNSSHFAGNSSSGVGFHPPNIIGRANNSTAAPVYQQQSLPRASSGYPMYHAGPQQQQQQQQYQQEVAGTAPATSWSAGTMAAAAPSGMFQPTGAWKPGGASYTQNSTGPIAAAATATPEPAHINTSTGGMGSDGGGGGGAEWTPPADQMLPYHDMWTTASAGCPVPGTVSGRAAVQFFSRSGLPKDALKMIWSLCDPSLTGRIRQPGFFAAMRLIAIAQQAPPSLSPPPIPSLSTLEARRFSPMPLPRMEGFPPPDSASRSGGGGSGGIEGLPSVPGAAGPGGGVSDPYAAASGTPPSLDGFPATPVVGGGGGVGSAAAMGGAAACNAVGVVGFPSPSSLSAGATGSPLPRAEESAQPQPRLVGMAMGSPGASLGGATSPVVGVEPAAAQGEQEEDEDGFGDFAGAQEEAQPPPAPLADDDDGDDFGDFSGAPTSADEQASAQTTVAPCGGGVAKATSGGGGGGGDVAWMMEDGGKGAASSARGGMETRGKGGGLDDLIESNLHPTMAEPVHLADMQSTPSLMGKAPDPVMVDRASVAHNKLSVFDEMADLDLAVEQEDWNDFADETTAPPRSPTPPPPSPPLSPPTAAASASAAAAAAAAAAIFAEGAHDALAGVATAKATSASDGAAETREAPQPPVPPRESGLENDKGGSGSGSGSPVAMATGGEQESRPSSPFEGAEAVPVAPRNEPPASAPAQEALAEGQDDDWGDFEDAPGRNESGDGAAAAGGQGGATAAEADDDEEDEEWGTFTDAPAPSLVGEEGEADSGDGLKVAAGPGEEPGGGDGTGPPEAPQEAVDPFADIAPPTPPQSSLAYRGVDGEVASPGDKESTPAAEQVEEGDPASTEGGRLGRSRGASMTEAGHPLSLRGLRDALARHGRLEEAVEVQRRMELPSAPSARQQEHDDAAGDGSSRVARRGATGTLGVDAGIADSWGQGEDCDLERWREAAKLPPAPTVAELAKTMAADDPARAETFRARFVDGRPPVEEEALVAGGDAAALVVAIRRQRAARRAVYLSSMLGVPSESKVTTTRDILTAAGGDGGADGLDGNAAGEREGAAEVELGEGFGLYAKGSRPPPTLADWAGMTAYVTRMAEEGLAALKGGDGGGGHVPGGETTPTPMSPSPPPPPPPPPFSPTLGLDGAACAVADAASPHGSSDAKGAGAAVSGEVARSEKFVAFARGLREAVRVCRMTQAAAEDACLEGVGVAGFTAMERAWAELRGSAREAIGDSDGDDVCSVFGEEEGDEEGGGGQDGRHGWEGAGPGAAAGVEPTSSASAVLRPSLSGSGSEIPAGAGGRGRGSRNDGRLACSRVEAVREACVRHAPSGSPLCAVSLQPLAVFGGDGGGSGDGVHKSSAPPGVVEYCGVRYLASAVNLWVNALDKPPPGPLP
eukprot:g12878.t1